MQRPWGTNADSQNCALDERGLELSGVRKRHDLIVVTLQKERWYVELLQVPKGLVSKCRAQNSGLPKAVRMRRCASERSRAPRTAPAEPPIR